MAGLKKPTRKQKTCNCDAYKFPHRLDGGKCRELYNESDEGREPDSIHSLGLRSEFELTRGVMSSIFYM